MQKLGISAGIALSNLILDLTGYIKPAYPGAPAVADQPAAVLTALRIFVSFVPAAILLLSYVVVYYYPISRGRHAQIRAQLDHQHEHL